MDHRPQPTQPPPDHPQNPVTATPQLSITANHGGEEEGSAQHNSLPLKNFRVLVFKFIKPLTPADESLIEQRLCDFFPAISIIPDHPPYSVMIEEAVEKLNGGRGSCEEAISDYIKNKFNSLPWAHPSILAHHLNKLSKKGDIIMRCEEGYILRSAMNNTNPCADCESPTPKRRHLKRDMKRKRERDGSRKIIHGKKLGRPRKKYEIERLFQVQDEKIKKKMMMIQTTEIGGPRKKIHYKKRGRPRKNVKPEERQNDENRQSAEIKAIVDFKQTVPDHPPYAKMIKEALETLNEGMGCSEEAISEYIMNEYSNLPRALPTIVTHNLNKLSKKGDIIVRCEGGYILSSAIISSTTESDYSPSSSSYSSSSSISLDSDSLASDSSPITRMKNRKKSDIQGRGRGRGRGRPRKRDEIDGQFIDHDEKVKRKRGRPRKNNEPSEGYQLREELVDVAEEDHQAIKEVIQSVELEDHNQVEGRGAVEEREKHQKQEKLIREEIMVQREERKNDGGEENEEAAEKEVSANENQPWKQEDMVIAGEDQREEVHSYNGEQQDVVMVESVAQVDEIFDECSQQQKQEKEVIKVAEGECREKEQYNEIAQEGVHIEFEDSEGQFQEKEQQTDVIQLEDKVVEGIHHEEELGSLERNESEKQETDILELEEQNFQQEQLMDVIVDKNQQCRQQNVQVIVNDKQEEEDEEVEGWNAQIEQDRGGSLEHNEVAEELHQGEELQENDALKGNFLQQKDIMNVSEDNSGTCMEGTRENVQPCEQEEITEQQYCQEEQIQPCEQEEKLSIKVDCLRKPETESIHQQEEQQNSAIESKEQKEQEVGLVDREGNLEEELNVKEFEKEHQQERKHNEGNVENLQSCDVRNDVSKALPCKIFWSLMEDEKDKFLNNFRDQEMKSPCREGEISRSRIKYEQEHTKHPLESSPNSHIEEASYTGKGRSSGLIICGLPCQFSPPDHQKQRQSGRAGQRSSSRNMESERQCVRRSPRHLTSSTKSAAQTGEHDQSKERPKRPGLRSGKNMKAGV